MPKNRYWPDCEYTLPDALLSALDEYHILKVPLLGQHYIGGPEDWCGRTACSMVFNYYQAVQGGDFKSKLITHWDAGQGHFVDLRYPEGQRAFHNVPTDSPHSAPDGASVSVLNYQKGDVAVVTPPADFSATEKLSASYVLGFSSGHVLRFNTKNRAARAAQIANTPALVESQLAPLLDSLNANNPAILYSGFSMRKGAPIHLIVVCGYAWIMDDTGRHLWLVVADPSTNNGKLHTKTARAIYTAPSPDKATDFEEVAQGRLCGEHDIIRVIAGNWDEAQASLVLIRARKLFEENTHSSVSGDLYMDYWDSDDHKGGAFISSRKPTPVPPELLFSSVARTVAFPMDRQKERFRPVNCYAVTEHSGTGLFPLGSHRNLHSGVHLGLPLFEPARVSAAPSPAAAHKQVRCLAPGYVVAVRLANALREPSLEEQAKAGLEQNELSREFAGNHNSFLLVRHDVEEKPGTQGGGPRRFTFYSLYMHLAPPDWSKEDTYQDVAWLKTLARREGSITVIDPQHEAFQQVRWLQNSSIAGTTPTEDSPDLVPTLSGTYSVIGAGPGHPQPLQLGDASGGIYRGVLRKVDRDLSEIQESLVAGKVVTLCHPFLKVRAGDVLGYLDERSTAPGDGFLHWEVLAPSAPGQLQQFLSFAEEKLGLSKGGQPFFKFFEEKNPNNFFDPPVVRAAQGSSEKGELDALLELSPLSQHAEEPQKELLESFQATYSQQLLKQLLESARALPFTATDDAPASEPSYPVDVLIENYKGCLPSGRYTLRFTFEPSQLPAQEVAYDGQQSSVRLHVPARAKKLFVEAKTPGSLHVQPGASVGKDLLKRDAQHFQNLASVRWRNVVLRHLNEWRPESIVNQVKQHLKERKFLRLGKSVLEAAKQDDALPVIQEYAKAVGWWAHEETAVLGPEGDGGEKALFASGPDAEQLPIDALLDNPHPITFTWLLLLLTRHGFIQFADTPLWRSDEQKKLAAIGWLPAREQQEPRRVGEGVYVAALQRGLGEEEVTLHVKHGERQLDLARGKYKDGVFAQPVELPGWGTWTLHEPGAQALGALELVGLTPSLLKAPAPPGEDGTQSALTAEAPENHQDETFSWRVDFREHCPKSLRGWVLLRAWKGKLTDAVPTEPSLFQPTGLAIPVVAREMRALKQESGVTVAGGFIQKGGIKSASTYVTQHFTYKAFVDAAKGKAEPVLAWDLVEAVERIQCAYSAKQLVTLSALADDGLSLVLVATHLEKLRSAVAQAKDDGWVTEAEEAGKSTVRIRVRPPGESLHPGTLQVDFNASEAFARLREDLTHEDQLAVCFGCFFPNGGGAQDPRLRPSESMGKGAESVGEADLKREARGGYLELASTAVAEVLHRPMFGKPQARLTASAVQFVVPLPGWHRGLLGRGQARHHLPE